MKIISHRGLWNEAHQKNSLPSFLNSFEHNFGTETDLRDCNGDIVISHDVPGEQAVTLRQFLELYSSFESKELPLALNIKADGLQTILLVWVDEFSLSNYFVFDISVPDTLLYRSCGIKYFIRESEYENISPLYSDSEGIWLDCFHSIWYPMEHIERHLDNQKKVCLVSPELHKQDYMGLWEPLKDSRYHLEDNLLLCTDHPIIAEKFFNYED